MAPPRSDLPSSFVALWRSLALSYRAEPRLLALAFLASIGAAAPDALIAYALRLVAAAVTRGGGDVLVAAAVVATLAVAGWLLRTLSDRANLRFAEHAAVTIESHVARLQAGAATLEHHERPEHLDRLALLRDHAPALSQLPRSIFTTAGATVRLVLALGLLASVDPALIALVVLVVPTVVCSAWRGSVERSEEEATAHLRRLERHFFLLGTTPGPANDLRVARTLGVVRDRRGAAWQARHERMARARWASAVWQAIAWTTFGAGYLAALAWVASRGSVPDVVLTLVAGARLSAYVEHTATELHFLRTIWLDAARRLAWLEDFVAGQPEGHAAPPEQLRSGIAFDRVSFAYPGSDQPVLHDVSVVLPAGSVVALVGENGAGKTTFAKLVCGFYQPTSGRVLVDDHDLSALAPSAWRARISAVFQDFARFELIAQRTVGLGDLAHLDDRPAALAAVARAGATPDVAALPSQLDTQLGGTWPGGVEPSTGQWQKLAIARGLLRVDPVLVVLDEPTAAVDAETEDALFRSYAESARAARSVDNGRITVFVTHRFSTVRAADMIVVLDRGRLVECGSHDELVALGGHYAELYSIQAAGYRP